MLRITLLRVLGASLLLSSIASAADKWASLRTGMTRSETAAVLGTELVASGGRGFEVAIYDDRAEVLFLNGQVVAWTPPTSSKAASSPTDAWQFNQVSRTRSNASATPARRTETRQGNGPILPAYRL